MANWGKQVALLLLTASACGGDDTTSTQSNVNAGESDGGRLVLDASTPSGTSMDAGNMASGSASCDGVNSGTGGDQVFVSGDASNTNLDGTNCRIVGNGKLVDQTPQVGAFSGVLLSGHVVGELRTGPSTVRLHMDENLLPWLSERVADNVLTIGSRDPRAELVPSRDARVLITNPTYSVVGTTGVASVTGDVQGNSLDLNADGSSKMELNVQSQLLRIAANGNAQVTARGSAPTLVIVANGTAVVDSSVPATSIDVTASGGAHVTVLANGKIRVNASGAAIVTVVGDPTEHTYLTGGSGKIEMQK